jgi:hypothetical protein
MKIKSLDGSIAVIALTPKEIIMLNNALNEPCNGIDLSQSEFENRMGCTVEEAKRLLSEIGRAAASVKSSN